MDSERLLPEPIPFANCSIELTDIELQSLVALFKQSGWKVFARCLTHMQEAYTIKTLGNTECTHHSGFLAAQAGYLVGKWLKEVPAEAEKILEAFDESKLAEAQTAQE